MTDSLWTKIPLNVQHNSMQNYLGLKDCIGIESKPFNFTTNTKLRPSKFNKQFSAYAWKAKMQDPSKNKFVIELVIPVKVQEFVFDKRHF